MATKNLLVRIGVDLSELQKATGKVQGHFAKLNAVRRSAAENNKSGITTELEKAQAQMQKLEAEYKRLIAGSGQMLQENALLKSLKATEKAMQDIEKDGHKDKNGDFTNADDQKQFEMLSARADELYQKIKQIRLDPSGTAEAQELSAKIEQARTRVEELNGAEQQADKQLRTANAGSFFAKLRDGAAKASSTMKSLARAPLDALHKKLAACAEKAQKFGSRIKQLVASALIFNVLSAGFRKLQEGFVSLIQADGQLSGSLAQIKGNLLTAFAPIYNFILPAIRALFSALSGLTAQVASVMAALFGTTASAAQKTASALNNEMKAANGAASASNRSGADFDVLHKVGSSGGGSGADAASPSFSTDYGSVTVPPWMEKVQTALENLKQGFAGLKAAWLDAWNMDGAGEKIAAGFAGIRDRVLEHFVNITGMFRDWCGELDFSPLLNSLSKVVDAARPLVDILLDGLEWGFQNVLLPLGKWTIEAAVPEILNLFAAALGVVSSTIEALQPIAQPFWDDVLKPLGEWTGEAVIEALQWLTEKLNAFSDWIDENEEVVQNIVVVISSFAAAWALVNTAIGLWNVIGGIAAGVTAAFGAALAFVTSPIGIVTLAIGALIVAVVWLTKNWDEVKEAASKAWEKIKSAWNGAGKWFTDTGKKIAQGLKDGISSLWNNARTWGSDFVSNFSSGISSQMSGLLASVQSMASRVRSYLHFSVPDTGPLADADTWMPDMMQLLGNGIEDNSGALVRKVQHVAGEINGAFTASPSANLSGSRQLGSANALAQFDSGNADVIATLRSGFQALQRTLEESGGDIYMDGERVTKGVTRGQNRHSRMSGRDTWMG